MEGVGDAGIAEGGDSLGGTFEDELPEHARVDHQSVAVGAITIEEDYIHAQGNQRLADGTPGPFLHPLKERVQVLGLVVGQQG